MRHLLLYVFLLLFSCGPKVFEPLLVNTSFEEVREYEALDLRSVPAAERSTLHIVLSEEVVPDKENFFNNPGNMYQVKRPKVIIAVPEEISIKESNERDSEGQVSESILSSRFRTDGYFNEAEQAIEAALLRKGFDVLDRSKFEAKLRDLRDRADQIHRSIQHLEHLLENKDFDKVKEVLEEELVNGVTTKEEYLIAMAEVDKLSQIGLPGEKRTEDEMNDIAEVIRVSQIGEDRADFVLQINDLFVSNAGDRNLTIQDMPEVKAFMEDHPGLRFGSTPQALPPKIASNWLKVEFIAKLIDVESGSIVWLGSHELESWAAEPIEISIDIQKIVSNGDEINGAIKKYNQNISNLSQKVTLEKQDLNEIRSLASEKKEFKKKEDLELYNQKIRADLKVAEEDYLSAVRRLNRALEEMPKEIDDSWKFYYIVSDPILTPDLISESRGGDMEQQHLMRHKRELVRTVTQQLLNTIDFAKT